MSQERTSLTYVSRSSRGTVEYIIRPRLLFSESYHMNSECMLSSEKVFLKTLKIKTIGIPPKKLCKFLQSRRTAEVGGFSPSSQGTWAPHGPRFVPAPCPPLFLLPLWPQKHPTRNTDVCSFQDPSTAWGVSEGLGVVGQKGCLWHPLTCWHSEHTGLGSHMTTEQVKESWGNKWSCLALPSRSHVTSSSTPLLDGSPQTRSWGSRGEAGSPL